MPRVTCASDTCSGLGPHPEPPDRILGKFSPLGPAPPALPSCPCQRQAPCQGHPRNGTRYPGNLRPRHGGGGLGMQPRGREDDACHTRGPWCKGTQLISCQERGKLQPGPSPAISPGIALRHRVSPHDKRKYVQSGATNKRQGGSQTQGEADCL